MNETVWNPWHGCHKYSPGCANCYVYRRDATYDRDASKVERNKDFALPLRRARSGEYKIAPGTHVYACMTSDFFLSDADAWRSECWDMIRERSDLRFTIITKRIVRFAECAPPDWGDGWEHVAVCCTIEDQEQCDRRFPVFNSLPIKHKMLACEPLLGAIDMSAYLTSEIDLLVAGGESGNEARMCDYNWILDLRRQCINAGVRFYFKQTGARFLKDGRLYRIARKYQHSQAKKAKINT